MLWAYIVACCTVAMCSVWSYIDASAARFALWVGHDNQSDARQHLSNSLDGAMQLTNGLKMCFLSQQCSRRFVHLCYSKQSDTRHLRVIVRSAHNPSRRMRLARAHVAHPSASA